MVAAAFPLSAARRPRALVRAAGPDAEAFLQRLLSNDVAALAPGDACEALLLTAKARVIAPLRVLREGQEAFVLLTEPELGLRVERELLRMRLAAKVDVRREQLATTLVLGSPPPAGAVAVPNDDYGVTGYELLDASAEPPADARAIGDEELERLRIEAGTPRFGAEIDDRVLPAEAGLVERAVSFSKGCYPGQEPIARLHHRGHANRGLRRLVLDAAGPPPYDAELRVGDKVVGRVTSAVRAPDGHVVALAYVRREVPAEAELAGPGFTARSLD